MGMGNPPPKLVYNVIRGVMFLLTFVLEDWAIYEFVPSPRHRRATIVLVASSYVTWTYQTHTFSNSLETLLVAWGLVLIRRIVENKVGTHKYLVTLNRLIYVATLFAFLLRRARIHRRSWCLQSHHFPSFPRPSGAPAVAAFSAQVSICVHFLSRLPLTHDSPLSILSFIPSGLFFAFIAILGDTIFYKPSVSLIEALRSPVITPLNNFLYNSDASNLAHHGLHPHYQHFLANLPQLLGPAYIMMIASLFSGNPKRPLAIPSWVKNMRAASAISATILLSVFPHQEPRFLIPCIPLLLSCFHMQSTRKQSVLLQGAWVIFNVAMAVLMGIYHQGGVVPTQLAIPGIIADHRAGQDAAAATVFWWKTYSPPRWLLGESLDITTNDLMGIPGEELISHLNQTLPTCPVDVNNIDKDKEIYVVAPKSATFLDRYIPTSSSQSNEEKEDIELHELWYYKKHLNLDDLDFGDDGVIPTLFRVVGRRGLGVWAARRQCLSEDKGPD